MLCSDWLHGKPTAKYDCVGAWVERLVAVDWCEDQEMCRILTRVF